MDDLVTWLRTALDDDERVAQAAAGGGQWRYEGGDSVGAWTLYDEHWNIASLTTYDTTAYDYAARMPAFRSPDYVDPDANGRHIARHDPARVLREVTARRAIVDRCVRASAEQGLYGEDGQDAVAEHVLRHLAAVYADRDGYQTEWAP